MTNLGFPDLQGNNLTAKTRLALPTSVPIGDWFIIRVEIIGQTGKVDKTTLLTHLSMVSESTYLFGGLRSRKLPALDLPVDVDSPAGGASINYGSHLS